MGFFLHGVKLRVLEKSLPNSGPFREVADKHSICTQLFLYCQAIGTEKSAAYSGVYVEKVYI
jgi:hypothetical protein